MEKTVELTLGKLQKYCAYQERCHSEVRSKILEYEIYGEDLEALISMLIEDNFLNEERFTAAFVIDKFRFNAWGRIKIKMALKQKGVSEYCIKKGLEMIDGNDYADSLKNILFKKNKIVTEQNFYKRKQKLATYAQQKGYELDLIWQIISTLIE